MVHSPTTNKITGSVTVYVKQHGAFQAFPIITTWSGFGQVFVFKIFQIRQDFKWFLYNTTLCDHVSPIPENDVLGEL